MSKPEKERRQQERRVSAATVIYPEQLRKHRDDRLNGKLRHGSDRRKAPSTPEKVREPLPGHPINRTMHPVNRSLRPTKRGEVSIPDTPAPMNLTAQGALLAIDQWVQKVMPLCVGGHWEGCNCVGTRIHELASDKYPDLYADRFHKDVLKIVESLMGASAEPEIGILKRLAEAVERFEMVRYPIGRAASPTPTPPSSSTEGAREWLKRRVNCADAGTFDVSYVRLSDGKEFDAGESCDELLEAYAASRKDGK